MYEELVRRLRDDEAWKNCDFDFIYGWMHEAADAIEELSSTDVRPVVRGRNICDTVNGHCEFKCSVCGTELSSVYGGNNDFGLDGGYFNYCPNCGALMEDMHDHFRDDTKMMGLSKEGE